MSQTNNIGPYIELFYDLYPSYVQSGYLEPHPEACEAYITDAALYTLVRSDDSEPSPGAVSGPTAEYLMHGRISRRTYTRMLVEARRIRGYCDFLNTREGIKAEARQPGAFALHVVESKQNHDLLYTILLTRKRWWWWPWATLERANVITY